MLTIMTDLTQQSRLRSILLKQSSGFVPSVLFLMRLAHVLLPCVSESFSAVDFFQKYSALKIKGFFPHLRWTLDGCSALVIGLLCLRWTRLFRVQCTHRNNTREKKNCHVHAH